ncbi:hypothetical protein NEAUS05_1721 [Nematocida ausubeli]|nr:hypothetical protein NEAUS05_1721 [Nematocida ausubeli]
MNYWIIGLLLMNCVLGRMNIQDVRDIHYTLIGEKEVIINPDGALNPLRGYITRRNAYMHNKRFYSCEIDTHYLLRLKDIDNPYMQEYEFTRTPASDKVYDDLNEDTCTNKYLKMYHSQLIKMFPSVDGDISIEAGRPNMLTNFLRAAHVKKDAKYILAAFLLLSEGIDIKISVDKKEEKKRLIIKSKRVEGKEFVNVELYLAGIDPVTLKYKEDIYQSEVVKGVNFYLRCRDNPLIKKGGEFSMPATKEEFESGRFLNNAGFLIQTYIYEYIDNIQEYKAFLEAVYELLEDQITKGSGAEGKKKEKMERIFKKFFLGKDSLGENKKCIMPFYNLMKAADDDSVFPFYNSSHLPRYTRVPCLKLDKSGFDLDQAAYYSNCVETGLLGLFCCLAYNPETKRYETSHMGDKISDELKDFFEKYSRPAETTDLEMYKEWCKVVACLENDKINYKYPKNELFSGVANIFLAIAEITGEKAEILKLVEYIEECTSGELDYSQQEYISDKIELIIASLSKNKNVQVNCDKMEIEQGTGSNLDLFCSININYTFNGTYSGISICVKRGHTILSLLSELDSNSSIKEKYVEARKIYSEMNSYTGCMITQCIDVEINNTTMDSLDVEGDFLKKVDTIIEDGYENMSKVFLLEKLAYINFRPYFIEKIITHSLEKELTPKDPATRFVANILGSLPLNDAITRHASMELFPFHSNWQVLFPRLGYAPLQHLPEAVIMRLYTLRRYYSLVQKCSVFAATKALCNYLQATVDNRGRYYAILYFSETRNMFESILKTRLVQHLAEIHSVIEKTKDPNDLGRINIVYIYWFILACKEKVNFSLEIIQMVYRFIHFDHLQGIDSSKLKEYYVYIDIVIRILEEEKSLFLTEIDNESTKNYNNLLEYFKTIDLSAACTCS